MLADCWFEGMRSATGDPSWSRHATAGGAVKVLQALLSSSAPADGDKLGWARSLAAEYAAAAAGGTMNVFGFQTWLQSGKRTRSARPVALVQPVPAKGRAWKVGDGQ